MSLIIYVKMTSAFDCFSGNVSAISFQLLYSVYRSLIKKVKDLWKIAFNQCYPDVLQYKCNINC